MDTFISRLKQACQRAGIGERQSEISRAIGVKKQNVNWWFTQDTAPDQETMRVISKKLGVRYEWLAFGELPMSPEPKDDNLSEQERKIIRAYRSTTPKMRQVLTAMVRAVRKVAVVVVAAIPPLLPGQDVQGATLHKKVCDTVRMHIVRRFRYLYLLRFAS